MSVPRTVHQEGATLGYREWGDPRGHPLLLHHGLVGGSLSSPLWDELGRREGIRVISVERPGYGASPPVPMTAVGDWAPMARSLLDALDVEHLDVAGVSAGAPYCYALAARLPERVRGVWVLSGLPYVYDDAVRAHYPDSSLRAWEFYRDAPLPEVAASFAEAAPRFARTFAGQPTLLGALEEMAGHGHLGPAREAKLQVRPWGFALSEVRAPVRLWHSPGDDQVPYPAARATADLLPDARLTDQSEPSHFPSETVVRQLMAELGQRR
ncbi:alpha/beta hydrolase [Streptomyces sp. NPDC005438]|uniref:alpha/beta fold hydrolase n=1 Tax=Streptomyces sp. NPDC005438 TaxID=3156880 RepID=UPI0033B8E4BF